MMLNKYISKLAEKEIEKKIILTNLNTAKSEYARSHEQDLAASVLIERAWEKVEIEKLRLKEVKKTKNKEQIAISCHTLNVKLNEWKDIAEIVIKIKKRNKNINKRVNKTSMEFIKCIDSILHLKLKIEEYELTNSISIIDTAIADDKKKLKKLSAISEPILARVYYLPQELKNIIRSYFTMDTRAAIIEDKFVQILNSYKSGPAPIMFRPFLEFIGTCPEFLQLLPKKEARHQIPSLTPRGFQWRQYVYCDEIKYPKLLRNRIRWAAQLAKIGNPAFAHKIMKTIIIFSQPHKYTLSGASAKKYLTLEDLPSEYR